jgi:hypothetical protein
MLYRKRPVTQLENFAPTTSRDENLDTPQTRAALSNDATSLANIRIPEKRKAEEESHSQASKST